MIFALLKKYWKNILDALIIVALILVIFIINPWNIFGGKLRTNYTANNITAIREIGELVTAEYYGEAIATIDQSRLQLIYADNINFRADSIFLKFKKDLLNFYVKAVMEKVPEKKTDFFNRTFERISSLFVKDDVMKNVKDKFDKIWNPVTDELSLIVLEYFHAVNDNSDLKPEKSLKSDKSKDVLWIIMQQIITNTDDTIGYKTEKYLLEGLPAYNNQVFSDYYYNKKREEFSRKDEKKELSMIGRGWVKAGFKFDKLDENNFFFDKENGIVHLFGVHAEILNADINPWFIPEKKIPGFQIIEANKNVDFNDAVKVKMYCVEKLRKMAIDAGILQQAEIQGKETLKSFIGLLTGTEIKEVYFHYDNFSVLTKEILNDEFISYEESRMLDTLIEQQIDTILKLDSEKTNYTSNQQLKEVKILQLQAAISNLKKAFFEEKGRYFNRLSSLVFRITADSILTGKELQEIISYRWDIEKTLLTNSETQSRFENKLWYSNSLEFINEYNSALEEVRLATKHYGNRHDTLFKETNEHDSFIKNLKKYISINTKKYKKETVFTYVDNLFSDSALIATKYPITVAPDWQELLDDNKTIHSINKNKTDKTGDTMFIGAAITSQIVDSTNTSEFKELSVSIDKNKFWHVDTTSITNKEKIYFLEYCINYYKANNTGFFTRTNKRIKESIGPAKMRERVEAFRKSDNIFN